MDGRIQVGTWRGNIFASFNKNNIKPALMLVLQEIRQERRLMLALPNVLHDLVLQTQEMVLTFVLLIFPLRDLRRPELSPMLVLLPLRKVLRKP